MARPKSVQNPEFLAAALEGLELQRQRIEDQIAQVRSMLGTQPRGPGRPPTKAAPTEAKKRTLSPAARKRIAAAQKKRWAEFRKNTESTEE